MAAGERDIAVAAAGVILNGTLNVPERARGVVLFAHGSGSSRHSARNRYVAAFLHSRGLATLLMDLLTVQEELAERWTRHLRFDVDLLARRLLYATAWLTRHESTRGLSLGYFGASTGAGAALVAAARAPARIAAVVSRGGRPDLAGEHLPRVRAATLLMVGSQDAAVLRVNRGACHVLRCESALDVVPGATHLFEEPGTLEIVAHLAAAWFTQHLAPVDRQLGSARTAAGFTR